MSEIIHDILLTDLQRDEQPSCKLICDPDYIGKHALVRHKHIHRVSRAGTYLVDI